MGHSASLEESLQVLLRELTREREALMDLRSGIDARPRERVPQPDEDRSEVAPTDLTGQLERIEQRLARLERSSQLLLARRSGSDGPQALRVPPGVPVREFMAAIEELDDDESTEMHKLWSGDQLRRTYGPPDRIEDRDSYIEWIYMLPDGEEQLDFHLIGGLVVLAH